MSDNRVKSIFRASVAGIFVNAGLGAFKAVIGMITGSIAISMDGVNNFADAGSSFITMLGTSLAAKTPDKKHPFGYGRLEYLTTLLIGGLISYAGITSLVESVQAVAAHEPAEYSVTSLAIILVAVIVKIFLTLYIAGVGKRTHSDALIASGKEAVGDIAVSIATLVAALIYMFAGISLEAWLGIIISALIIKAGVETLIDSVSKILGGSGDVALVQSIKKTLAAHEEVEGAFDLILHNYGPDKHMGSVHIAVADTMQVKELDDLTRRLQDEIEEKFDIYLAAVGIYSVNTKDPEVIALREKISEIVTRNQHVHQMHGFYVNKETKDMRFDLVIGFEPKDRKAVYDQAIEAVKAEFPEYTFNVGLDSDFNECL